MHKKPTGSDRKCPKWPLFKKRSFWTLQVTSDWLFSHQQVISSPLYYIIEAQGRRICQIPKNLIKKNFFDKLFWNFFLKKGAFFSGLWGYLTSLTKRLKIFLCLFNKKVIRGGPWHFLLTKFFRKNLKFFFDFFRIQRVPPLDSKKNLKNRKKNSNFSWKILLIKNVKDHPWWLFC